MIVHNLKKTVQLIVTYPKWSFRKLFKYALDGIIAFSTVPLKISLIVGSLASSFGFIYGFYIVLKTLILGKETPGYASLMAVILFFSGVTLICIGILGEYISRIYIEVKNRPIFIIDETNIENVYD